MAEADDIYQDLPADPEQAFLVLERIYRHECQSNLAHLDSQSDPSIYQVDYIAKVIGAITELGLADHFNTEIPLIEEVSNSTYLNFSKDVKNYCTRLEIRFGRRRQGFTVRFDSTSRSEIHNYVTKIREVVGVLEVVPAKKDALFRYLNAFAVEVDRDRTRLEAFGELVLQVSSIVGEAAEKLEPVRKWVDSIGKIINGARSSEPEMPRLPPKEPQKRIEVRTSSKGGDRTLDDEVPF